MVLKTNDPNLYFTLSQRFYLEVPLLREVEDKEKNKKQAYVPCVVLSQWEEEQCKYTAEQETLKIFNGQRPKIDEVSNWKTVYEDQFYANIIFKAFRCPGDLDKELFLSKKQVIDEYSSHELSVYYMNYSTVVLNQPYMKHLKSDDKDAYSKLLDTVISHATETQTAFFLSSYTTLSLATLVRSLVKEVTNLQSGNGSSGTPSNAT